MKKINRLYFSCAHEPYTHPDFVDFLVAVRKKYKVNDKEIYNLGDMISNEGVSDHLINPDLPNQGTELEMVKKNLKAKWYKKFPYLKSVSSNHEKRIDKRAKKAGIPKKYLKKMSDVLETPKGWVWYNNLTVKLSKDVNAFLAHTVSVNLRKAVLAVGACVIQGHNHSELRVSYINTPYNSDRFGANVGCGIDDTSVAMDYNKDQIARPVLGCLVTEGVRPTAIRMRLNKKNRWNGEVE